MTDIQEAVTTNEDKNNWRRFVASVYGPCWPQELSRSGCC